MEIVRWREGTTRQPAIVVKNSNGGCVVVHHMQAYEELLYGD
jgi:hypothetical protein